MSKMSDHQIDMMDVIRQNDERQGPTCARCHRTEEEADTMILGDVCGDCADDLRDHERADECDPDGSCDTSPRHTSTLSQCH